VYQVGPGNKASFLLTHKHKQNSKQQESKQQDSKKVPIGGYIVRDNHYFKSTMLQYHEKQK